ncbi:MAG: hypothetical protein ACT6FD_05065 [Methanosarcinaceae archaeon]
MKSFASIVILLAVILGLLIVPSSAVIENGQYMQVERMVMTFEKADARVDIFYNLDIFVEVYVFLLGSHNLELTFERMFSDFDEVEVTKIGQDHAVVLLNNVSRKSGEYYLHDSHKIGVNVGELTIMSPDGSTKQLKNARCTQNTFYS